MFFRPRYSFWATEVYGRPNYCLEGFLVITVSLTMTLAQRLKHLPPMRETRVQSLGREGPLEKEMATHSSTLAWRIPWMEEPGRLQSTGSQRVGHDWATSLHSKPDGATLLLRIERVCVCVLSRVWLSATLWTVHGIIQARILEWVAISYYRGSSQLRDQTHGSCIGIQILYHWATWEAQDRVYFSRFHVPLFALASSRFPANESSYWQIISLKGYRVTVDEQLLCFPKKCSNCQDIPISCPFLVLVELWCLKSFLPLFTVVTNWFNL